MAGQVTGSGRIRRQRSTTGQITIMSDDSTFSIQAGEIVDRFYGALQCKDLQAARACCTEDAIFWHNFDGIAQDLEQVSKGWQGLFSMFEENRVVDIRREAVTGGIVQRHLFLLRGEDGVLRGKPCCIFVSVHDGLIRRLDEYIDLSADLTVAEDVRLTAGLPAQERII